MNTWIILLGVVVALILWPFTVKIVKQYERGGWYFALGDWSE